MGWDEKLFGIVYRALRGRKKTAEEQRGAALLAPIRARLHFFAAGIAGRKVEIGVAEDVGRRSGTRLLLPPAIALAPDPETNERAYLLRAAIDATALRLALEPERVLSPAERAAFSLLALPAVLAALDDDLPGARAHLDALAPFALAARPALARMPPAAARIEVLTRLELGMTWGDLARETSPEVLRRAREIHAVGRRDRSSIMEALADLTAGVRDSDVVPVVLWGTTGYDPGASRSAVAPSGQTPDATGTERKGKTREDLRVIALDESPLEENPMTHSFEKVHTVEEYSGGRKKTDATDELAAHGDALDEIEMREVVRSRERPRSLYRAEVTFEGDQAAPDVADAAIEGGIPYDEWDEGAHAYRKAHCRVFVSHARRPVDLAATLGNIRAIVQRNARNVRDLESRFELIERARRERGRQPDGPDIDVDAIVERHGSLAAGHTGEDKLYVGRRPHVQDLAVSILIDASLSSDAWVANRRVLDVAKEAVFVLAEALSNLTIQASVAAFYSNTRRDCRYVIVKPFEAEWQPATATLATVTPTAYTRIGPALRHGAALLEATGARRKLLLMVGDGKPTDFDRYEGRYGIADVRQAVRESEQRGIHTFALAIDETARRQLPQMFGPKGYEVLRRPGDLVLALGRVCADLAR